MIEINDEVKKVYQKALETRQKAHAPYSKFFVGAALKLKGQNQIFSGCNVENASFGATVCAERNAIFQAIAHHGKHSIDFMVLVTDTDPIARPCGICRQVIQEFAEANTKIYLANLKGVQQVVSQGELLPSAFELKSKVSYKP